MDTLTSQIVRQIERLPARKKAALLELLRAEDPPAEDPVSERQTAWREALLSASVWSDEDLQPIRQARAWMSQWTPRSS